MWRFIKSALLDQRIGFFLLGVLFGTFGWGAMLVILAASYRSDFVAM